MIARPTSSQGAPLPRSGDPPAQAASALLDLYGPRLFSLARRLCRNEADAEDLVQDVFLQAFRKWDTFRGQSSPGTWLYAIAARSCKSRVRRRGGIDRRTPAVSQVSSRPSARLPDGSTDSPLEEAAGHESAAVVQAALLTLPEHFRLPLIFKEVFGLSVDQTAEALKLKPQTVKSRLHRARLLLRGEVERQRTPGHALPVRYDDPTCRNLLKQKLQAMDDGREFPVDPRGICARCQAAVADLDLIQRACVQMANGPLPGHIRAAVLRALEPAVPIERRSRAT